MLKKKKISDAPLTYRLYEVLPTLEPIRLGEIEEIRLEHWRWTSRFGGNSGEGPLEFGINKIIVCAQRSECIQKVKKKGMRT